MEPRKLDPAEQWMIDLIVPFGVMLGAFSVVGVLGNGVVITVYARKLHQQHHQRYMRFRHSESSSLLILCLACADLFTCLFVIPGTVASKALLDELHSDLLCRIMQFANGSVIPFSALLMALIALDRFIAVCCPANNCFTLNLNKLFVLFCLLFACCLGVFVALLHSTYMLPINDTLFNDTDYVYRNESQLVYTGVCDFSAHLLGMAFAMKFRYVHLSTYFLAIVVVVGLYSKIYWSTRQRHLAAQQRRARARQVLSEHGESEWWTSVEVRPTTSVGGGRAAAERARKSPLRTWPENGREDAPAALDAPDDVAPDAASLLDPFNHSDGTPSPHAPLPSMRRRLASETTDFLTTNVRLALMLFVVALVFIVSYLPAAFTLLGIIRNFHPFLFYVHFLMNCANPVIYSFMNKYFRQELRTLLRRRRPASAQLAHLSLSHRH